jgi:L-threonylcarbamoyladenylate synthase
MPVYEEDIKNCLITLKKGGVILYPTDTIWGLGCDATNKEAVEKIFKIKQREAGKSFIILVDNETMIERYATDIPDISFQLIEVSDKPLTIIYPGGKNLAAGICNEDNSIGIRVCKEPFCQELINRFRKPIVSTSANLSGKPSPGNYDEIDRKVTESVDYVVRYRQDDLNKYNSSSVIKLLKDGTIKIIR